MSHTAYKPRPGAGVDALQYIGKASARSIVEWVEEFRGRGAAWMSEDGTSLMVPAEEFGSKPIWVPLGWVVYKEFLSDRFHIIPQELFEAQYEVRT